MEIGQELLKNHVRNLGRNRYVPKATSNFTLFLGLVTVQFSLTGRLTKPERREILLLIYRHFKPLLKQNTLASIRHVDSKQIDLWRNNRRKVSLKRSLKCESEAERLGLFLRLKRQEKGMSQEQMATVLGMDRSHVSRIEHGRHNVGRKIFDRILAL